MAAIPIIAGIATVAGVGASVIGQANAAAAQAKADQQDAANKNLEANELLAREAINETNLRNKSLAVETAQRIQLGQSQAALNIKSAELQSQYGADFAGTGREGGGIGGILKIQHDTNIANSIMTNNLETSMSLARSDLKIGLDAGAREAAFKAEMLRRGASISTGLASDSYAAGALGITSTVLGGVGKAYENNLFNIKTTGSADLPQVNSYGGLGRGDVLDFFDSMKYKG